MPNIGGPSSSAAAALTLRRIKAGDHAEQASHGTRDVIIRYASGKVERGYTYELDPRLPSFRLFQSDVIGSRSVPVWLRDVTSVAFVRRHSGQSSGGVNEERPGRDVSAEARGVRVTLRDGEVLVGYASSCDRRQLGFFVVPAEAGDTERVFVVFDAVESLELD